MISGATGLPHIEWYLSLITVVVVLRAYTLCVLQGRIGLPMAFSPRFLGHWPKDGPAALADGRRSSTLHFIASILLGVVGASLQEK